MRGVRGGLGLKGDALGAGGAPWGLGWCLGGWEGALGLRGRLEAGILGIFNILFIFFVDIKYIRYYTDIYYR